MLFLWAAAFPTSSIHPGFFLDLDSLDGALLTEGAGAVCALLRFVLNVGLLVRCEVADLGIAPRTFMICIRFLLNLDSRGTNERYLWIELAFPIGAFLRFLLNERDLMC